MTTVINTPPNTEQTDGGGWAVSVILLIVVIGIGLFFWLSYRNTPVTGVPETADTSANINVTLPSTNTDEPENTVQE